MKKGFGGSAKDKKTWLNTKVATGLDYVVDLAKDNKSGVIYQAFGRPDKFPRGFLSDKYGIRC